MKIRSNLALHVDVILAIFFRELQSRYQGKRFGMFFAMLEPLLLIAVFLALRATRGRGDFGFVSPYIFIWAGFGFFLLLWRGGIKESHTAINGLKKYRAFRQVQLFDIVITRMFSTFLIVCMATVVALSIFYWWGLDQTIPEDPLTIVILMFVLLILANSWGLTSVTIRNFSKFIGQAMGFMTFPLLFLSAVFYPMSIVPEPSRTYLSYNPIVHVLEGIRDAWFLAYQSPVLDFMYLFYWVAGMTFFAISIYFIYRHKLEK